MVDAGAQQFLMVFQDDAIRLEPGGSVAMVDIDDIVSPPTRPRRSQRLERIFSRAIADWSVVVVYVNHVPQLAGPLGSSHTPAVGCSERYGRCDALAPAGDFRGVNCPVTRRSLKRTRMNPVRYNQQPEYATNPVTGQLWNVVSRRQQQHSSRRWHG